MKSLPNNFYKQADWIQCRANYLKYCGGFCERCKAKGLLIPADIVHHKIYLNEDNYRDANVSLNFENLEALCQKCHNAEHFGKSKQAKRYRVINGKLIF